MPGESCMPFISVIVPVHGVEPYLRECLDSILGQSFTDFELIAVDDASPDGSAAVLAEYASRDGRVRVVSLAENVGLGRARNAGFDQATGDYVWFVDGDDRLADDGAMQAIADRARALATDVLVFGWRRWHPGGDSRRAGHQELLAEAPEVFRLSEFLSLIYVVPFSWNKLVRRELMLRYDYRFEVGQYQDIDFTYLMLSVAERIGVLDRVCVDYRQREHAVTRSVSDKHFAIFDHWERAFELVERHAPACPARRSVMFGRMIRHYLFVFDYPGRIPPASRRRYFETMVAHYRRYRPAEGYAMPSRAEMLKHGIVRLGWYELADARRKAGEIKKGLRTAIGSRKTGRGASLFDASSAEG